MKFYVATDADGKRHLEGRQDHAKAIDPNFTRIDIDPSFDGLKTFIEGLYAQIDGKADEPAGEVGEFTPGHVTQVAAAPRLPSYCDFTIGIMDQFEKLSITQQLDLASIAMENARKHYKPIKVAAPSEG